MFVYSFVVRSVPGEYFHDYGYYMNIKNLTDCQTYISCFFNFVKNLYKCDYEKLS